MRLPARSRRARRPSAARRRGGDEDRVWHQRGGSPPKHVYGKRVRDDLVARGRAEEPAAVGADDDVLLAVAAHVGGRCALRRHRQLVAPQFLAVPRVERAEPAVDRRADEHEIAGRRDRAAGVRRAGRLDALGRELLELTERHAPGDVAGVRVDGHELAPRRFGAAPHVGVVPEARERPGRLDETLRGARQPTRAGAPPGAAAQRTRRRRAGRPRPATSCPHCPALCTLAMMSPSGLLNATPHQLLPPCAPGKHERVRADLPRFVGHRVGQLVRVPEVLTERLVLGRDLRRGRLA